MPSATPAGASARLRSMRYLHTMLRVRDLPAALDFFVTKLGLRELRRQESEAARFTLVFLGSGAEGDGAEIELTYNWDQTEPYPSGRFFGHLAYQVDDIYSTCARLRDAGVAILRPPRDGRMAFVKSPDGHSVELLQRGAALEKREPWAAMASQGEWGEKPRPRWGRAIFRSPARATLPCGRGARRDRRPRARARGAPRA